MKAMTDDRVAYQKNGLRSPADLRAEPAGGPAVERAPQRLAPAPGSNGSLLPQPTFQDNLSLVP